MKEKHPRQQVLAPDDSAFPPSHESKRVRFAAPVPPQSVPLRRSKSQPLLVDRCCNCTTGSTCSTARCACRQLGTYCRTCACIVRCTNKSKETISNTSTSAPDESPTPVEVLTHDTDSVATTTTSPVSREQSTASAGEASGTTTSAGEESVGTGQDGVEERRAGDLPGAVLSDADRLFDEVYGDHVHQNPGTHLHGGISDDAVWQAYWRRLIPLQPQQYNLPTGAVGRRFIETLTDLLIGVKRRKWNSERFFVFQTVVLQRTRDCVKARDIKNRLSWRMDAWDAGKFGMLVQTAVDDMTASMRFKRGGTTAEQRAKIFHAKMLRGDVRGAVKYLMATEEGGVLMPDAIDEKTGDSVEQVLRSKHPDARIPDASSLQHYDTTPDFVDLDITPTVVESVARELRGAAGVSGSDAHAVSHWLLGFGQASAGLRAALADFSAWLANDSPPWAAYRALMAGRLIAIDKCPGVRPIGIGETWRRAMAKCVLHVARNGAKDACGIDQLCAGLEAGIDGAIHAMQHMWDVHHMEEEWGFHLIDAENGFNLENRIVMLWTVRHEWPAGARFAFNCYRHCSILVIRGDIHHCVFLLSQEGVTQGDPLAMILYGLGLLPLIRQLKAEFPDVEQPWYADDAGAGGTFTSIRAHFKRLQELGPKFGYFPNPSKSIIVVPAHSLARAKAAFADLGFTVKTGSRYLGGFLGERDLFDSWIAKKTAYWSRAIEALASVAPAYPQDAYTGLQKSLQQEWHFVQRVVRDTGPHFAAVADTLSSVFLPALFGEPIDADDPRLALACLPVKQAGLALPNPVASADLNYKASTVLCTHLIDALRGRAEFSSATHSGTTRAVRAELRSRSLDCHNATLASIVHPLPNDTRRIIMRGCETGAWLSVLPSTVNGTELSRQEFRDSLYLRYALTPPDLPSLCDGCGQKFSVPHALDCPNGGLIIARHNELRDELCDLAVRAIGRPAVRDEPLIHPSRPAAQPTASDKSAHPVQCNRRKQFDNDDRGDVLIRGLWARGTDCILDIRVTDTDAQSNRSKDPKEVLAQHEQQKKKKYLAACLAQRRHFTPFVVSADGLLGNEAQSVLQNLSARFAEKSGKSYSAVCGFMRAHMSIAIVRATHLCLRGSRIPTSFMSHRPQWEDGAGLNLFRRF